MFYTFMYDVWLGNLLKPITIDNKPYVNSMYKGHGSKNYTTGTLI